MVLIFGIRYAKCFDLTLYFPFVVLVLRCRKIEKANSFNHWWRFNKVNIYFLKYDKRNVPLSFPGC